MKAILISILAIVTVNISAFSARPVSTKGTDGPNTTEYSVILSDLAPVTPSEATFDDADLNAGLIDILSLAPVTPKEATFEETVTLPSSPVRENLKPIEKGKSLHYDFPVPCDAKYGCSL